MIYAFESYELDSSTSELRRGGERVPVEPQVLALLSLLVENRERVIRKDELIARIWGGRAISEAALSSRIKSARKALGDDGSAQRLIKTIHGVGLRFVGEVREQAPAGGEASSRPTIAVLRFTPLGEEPMAGTIADALPHDIIVELARLRWLFVSARESSFLVSGAERVSGALGVSYCVRGHTEVLAGRLNVSVELIDTRSGEVIWGDRYGGPIGMVHEIRERIAGGVVTAVDVRLPANEASRALAAPQNFDAWSAYHSGLHHMYRFEHDGNQRAVACFNRAITLDPSMARPYAGMSFALFGDAFMRVARDPDEAATLARRYAEQALERDPIDPFCNLVMGRALWLEHDLEGSLGWLERAVSLNPNYAQGKYSRAWTQTLLGQARDGRASVDAAMSLSPLDPLLYGMLGVRALAHLGLGEHADAASWADRAAVSPRAHPLIAVVAAIANHAAGDKPRALQWIRKACSRHPGLSAADFLAVFPFADSATRATVDNALRDLGV